MREAILPVYRFAAVMVASAPVADVRSDPPPEAGVGASRLQDPLVSGNAVRGAQRLGKQAVTNVAVLPERLEWALAKQALPHPLLCGTIDRTLGAP